MDDRSVHLMRRARRAYETGRAGAALRRSILLLPVAALASWCCDHPAGTLAGGAILFALVTFCLWRGLEYRVGVRPGLIAGCVPLLLPLLTHASGVLGCATACLILPAMCGLGGVAGGVALGVAAPSPRRGGGVAFVTACLVAGLAGSMGCLLYGVVGLVVMTIGLIVGAAPVLAARRA